MWKVAIIVWLIAIFLLATTGCAPPAQAHEPPTNHLHFGHEVPVEIKVAEGGYVIELRFEKFEGRNMEVMRMWEPTFSDAVETARIATITAMTIAPDRIRFSVVSEPGWSYQHRTDPDPPQ